MTTRLAVARAVPCLDVPAFAAVGRAAPPAGPEATIESSLHAIPALSIVLPRPWPAPATAHHGYSAA